VVSSVVLPSGVHMTVSTGNGECYSWCVFWVISNTSDNALYTHSNKLNDYHWCTSVFVIKKELKTIDARIQKQIRYFSSGNQLRYSFFFFFGGGGGRLGILEAQNINFVYRLYRPRGFQ
jgi:hypothetical protein